MLPGPVWWLLGMKKSEVWGGQDLSGRFHRAATPSAGSVPSGAPPSPPVSEAEGSRGDECLRSLHRAR